MFWFWKNSDKSLFSDIQFFSEDNASWKLNLPNKFSYFYCDERQYKFLPKRDAATAVAEQDAT